MFKKLTCNFFFNCYILARYLAYGCRNHQWCGRKRKGCDAGF